MAHTYVVLGEMFTTKRDLTKRCQTILHAYTPPETLSDEHFRFVRDLLNMHHSAPVKVGVGVESIFVRDSGYGNTCFAVRRVDGSTTDFSFSNCLKVKPPSHNLCKACRTAILPQIREAKDNAFRSAGTIACPISGDPITRKNCHVDHAKPYTFEAIYRNWLQETALDPVSVRLSGNEDDATNYQILDPAILAAWQTYHKHYAVLRVVSKAANLSTLRKASK